MSASMCLCDGGHVTACVSVHGGGGGLIRETEAAAQGTRSLILNVRTWKPHASEHSFRLCHRLFSCVKTVGQ